MYKLGETVGTSLLLYLLSNRGSLLMGYQTNRLKTSSFFSFNNVRISSCYTFNICIYNLNVLSVMQCGFAFVEAGIVRSKNVTNIMMKNMLDTCKCTCCWCVLFFISSGIIKLLLFLLLLSISKPTSQSLEIDF